MFEQWFISHGCVRGPTLDGGLRGYRRVRQAALVEV